MLAAVVGLTCFVVGMFVGSARTKHRSVLPYFLTYATLVLGSPFLSGDLGWKSGQWTINLQINREPGGLQLLLGVVASLLVLWILLWAEQRIQARAERSLQGVSLAAASEFMRLTYGEGRLVAEAARRVGWSEQKGVRVFNIIKDCNLDV